MIERIPEVMGLGLAARGVHFARSARPILRGIDLALQPGNVTALLGPNGAGKSTLLRILLGVLAPTRGSVELNGKSLSVWSRRKLATQMAYVPQVHVPPFPYTVTDIVRLGRLPHHGILGAPGVEDRRRVDESIEQMGLTPLAHRPYTEISGGERQLALIARALAQGARYLILDEPAGGLDYGNQFRLLRRLQSLGSSGFGVLFTTHHPDHALQAARHVVLLRDGQIVSAGDPHDVLTSAAIADLYSIPQLTNEQQRTLQ